MQAERPWYGRELEEDGFDQGLEWLEEASKPKGEWSVPEESLRARDDQALDTVLARAQEAEEQARGRVEQARAAAARFRPLSAAETGLFLGSACPGDKALVESTEDLRDGGRPSGQLEAAWAAFALALARMGKAAGVRRALSARGILIDVCADGTPIVVRHYRAAPAGTSSAAVIRQAMQDRERRARRQQEEESAVGGDVSA